MVFIEDRASYLQRTNESPKLQAFHHFLLGKKESSRLPNISELDGQFFDIISSIQANDKTSFKAIYSRKSKSNPNRDSPAPFVNDDYLIFCLIIGICKFELDQSWIKNIISIRRRSATTITFENILNQNFYSTSNQPEVVLNFLQLFDQSKINNHFLNITFKSIVENTTLLESRDDFQILCAFNAYDLIIYQKEAISGNEVTLLKEFSHKFKNRMLLLSWMLQGGIFFGLIFGLIKIPIYSPRTIEFLDKYNFVFSIFGFLGLTFIGNQIPYFKNKSRELLMRLFGYPKGLLKK